MGNQHGCPGLAAAQLGGLSLVASIALFLFLVLLSLSLSLSLLYNEESSIYLYAFCMRKVLNIC